MAEIKYSELEKNFSFKKKYFRRTLWWKNILLVAPICFLFIGIVGLLYLFHLNKLVSWYVIPYLIFFIVGTILLKAIKRHLILQKIEDKSTFKICLVKPIYKEKDFIYGIFSIKNNRQHTHFLEPLKNNLLKIIDVNLIPNKLRIQKENNLGEPIYIKRFFIRDIERSIASWTYPYEFAILYIDDKNIFIVKDKDLIKY